MTPMMRKSDTLMREDERIAKRGNLRQLGRTKRQIWLDRAPCGIGLRLLGLMLRNHSI